MARAKYFPQISQEKRFITAVNTIMVSSVFFSEGRFRTDFALIWSVVRVCLHVVELKTKVPVSFPANFASTFVVNSLAYVLV